MPRVSLTKPPQKPLTAREKLKLTDTWSTPRKGHNETYANIADESTIEHANKAAEEGRRTPLDEAGTDLIFQEHQRKQQSRRALREAMRVTKEGE